MKTSLADLPRRSAGLLLAPALALVLVTAGLSVTTVVADETHLTISAAAYGATRKVEIQINKTALVDLKQVAYPLAADATPKQVETANATLVALKPQLTSCETLQATAEKVDGLVAGDLGEAEITDLAPAFQAAAAALEVGQVSDAP